MAYKTKFKKNVTIEIRIIRSYILFLLLNSYILSVHSKQKCSIENKFAHAAQNTH